MRAKDPFCRCRALLGYADTHLPEALSTDLSSFSRSSVLGTHLLLVEDIPQGHVASFQGRMRP